MFYHTGTCENQSMYVPFESTMLAHIPKKVWLIYVYISYNACANVCAYWYYNSLTKYLAIQTNNIIVA